MNFLRKRRQRWLQQAVGLFLVGLIGLSIHGARVSPVAASLRLGKRIPILVFGIDSADASQHTDTLMLTVFNPVENLVDVLSIPRDTRISLPHYRFRRINEIFGYHYRKTRDVDVSARKVLEGVEYLLDPADRSIQLPYFLELDYSGFRKMVDLLGGVWVQIRQPMHYDDQAGNLHIHFVPGRYLMNGKMALGYVRYRGATGDRGRILRQQKFIRSMAKKMASPLLAFRFPKLVGTLLSSIRTNLSLWDLAFLALSSRRLRSANFDFHILPGHPRRAYWSIKRGQAKRLASKLILGKTVGEDPLKPIVPQAEKITVSVWNASGKIGLARRVTKYLRKKGYDVVEYANYPVRQIPTRVIDRRGQIARARSVAGDLGVESFHSEVSRRYLVDVEVVLGENYNGVGSEK